MLVRDYFKVPYTEGDVGVEIEVEGANLPKGDHLWRKDNDGSLKPLQEAAEYILRSPVPINDIAKALIALKNNFEASKATVDNTYRAGIHVHVNVQDLTMPQMVTMVLLFIIVEDMFLNFCDKSRQGNHFCLRTSDASYFTEKLWEACEQNDPRLFQTDDLRYSAINLQSLHKYGSIEFRALESTQDYNKIVVWCKMLHALKLGAIKYQSPEHLIRSFSMDGFEPILREILGGYFTPLTSYASWKIKARAGLLRAQDIAFCRDWGKINLNIFAKNKEVF